MLPAPPVENPAGIAVFLDVDGTLVDIAGHPDLVEPAPGLVSTLDHASRRLDNALAVISGRTIESLDLLLAPLRLPTAGVHGLEYRDARGELHLTGPASLPGEAERRLAELERDNPGVWLERKRGTVAVHFRQCPDRASRIHRALEMLVGDLGSEYCLQSGKMVTELRPAGANKGTAIEAFMELPPFAGRQPVFIGDDVTDEDGFAVVNALGGLAVRVGPDDRPTRAGYGLRDVAAVLEWLEQIATFDAASRERNTL